MKRYRFTKPISTSVSILMIGGLLAGLFAIATVPLSAQPASNTRVVAPVHHYYDVTKEVTLSGTISKVVPKASRGMMLGSHLMLTTSSGAVDASLGRWGMQGKGALSVAAGQQVEVTGVMKTIREKQVFVARSVKVGARVYQVRNEHGIPVSPQSRERVNAKRFPNQKTALKGESL